MPGLTRMFRIPSAQESEKLEKAVTVDFKKLGDLKITLANLSTPVLNAKT